MRVTDEMVERGAKALCRLERMRLMAWNTILEPWAEMTEDAKKAYRTQARACLEAALRGEEDADR